MPVASPAGLLQQGHSMGGNKECKKNLGETQYLEIERTFQIRLCRYPWTKTCRRSFFICTILQCDDIMIFYKPHDCETQGMLDIFLKWRSPNRNNSNYTLSLVINGICTLCFIFTIFQLKTWINDLAIYVTCKYTNRLKLLWLDRYRPINTAFHLKWVFFTYILTQR